MHQLEFPYPLHFQFDFSFRSLKSWETVTKAWSFFSFFSYISKSPKKPVTTIEWSPAIVTTPNGSTVRVLLSTGNDCMVIFWSFNEKDKQFDSGQPIRFCERTKSSDKATQQERGVFTF